ncbi:MAG: hypothetical protein ACLFUC_04010 [Bacteroidales bacterium]
MNRWPNRFYIGDKNRAGVIILSVVNETLVGEERNKFLVDLVNVVKSIDDQEKLYHEAIKISNKIPQFRGRSPWILADLRSHKKKFGKCAGRMEQEWYDLPL